MQSSPCTWEGCIIFNFRGNRHRRSHWSFKLTRAAQTPVRCTLLVSVASICLVVAAGAENYTNSTEITLTPRICILSEETKTCEETVMIHWRTDARRSTCLYRSEEASPIECWQQESAGELELTLTAEESVEFELRDFDNDLVVLAKAEFKVLHDRKKYRRSRRNPWSFF